MSAERRAELLAAALDEHHPEFGRCICGWAWTAGSVTYRQHVAEAITETVDRIVAEAVAAERAALARVRKLADELNAVQPEDIYDEAENGYVGGLAEAARRIRSTLRPALSPATATGRDEKPCTCRNGPRVYPDAPPAHDLTCAAGRDEKRAQ